MAYFDRFRRRWAATGTVSPPTDAQADAGFAYLGSNPPTVELFNALFRDIDDKDGWLFENLNGVMVEGGVAPSAADTAGLVTAVRAMVLARTGPLQNLHDADMAVLNAYNAGQDNRLAALEAKGNVAGFGVPGAHTWQAGPRTTRVRVRLCGGGGGGANCNANGTGTSRSGGGGGAGGYAEGIYIVVPGQTYAVVVGAGGGAQSNGGTSSFGGFLSATGGRGATFQSAISSAGGAGGGGSGGNVLNAAGGLGSDGQSGGLVFAGNGAPGPWGGGGRARQLDAPIPAPGFGAGGGGVYDSNDTGVNAPGSPGGPGLVLVEW